MLKIKSVTAKNFLSIGAVTQSVNLDRDDLTLVIGENLDLGGVDSGSKNGVGKSAMLNAISYALYGQALTNIKKDNLINKSNGKNMLVTVEFEKNGIDYRIERGRRPNTMAFYVGNVEQEITDDSQGDSRETQADIDRLLGMSHDMFKQTVALNTYNEPFLSLRSGDQRAIIEQLLGITVLSEKAEKLKELIKVTKDGITQEEFRIKAVGDANKRIQDQIENLKRRQQIWLKKKTDDLNQFQIAYDELSHLDIEKELLAHRDLSKFNQKSKDLAELNKAVKRAELDYGREIKHQQSLQKELSALKEHRCHSCGQEYHDANHDQLVKGKEEELASSIANSNEHIETITELNAAITELGTLGTPPKVYYDRESDAFEHRSSMAGLLNQISSKQAETDPYEDQIEEMIDKGLETVSYDQINELISLRDHQEFLLKLLTNKDSFVRKKIIDQNLSYLNARLGQYLDRIGLPHTVQFNNDLSVSITELGRELDFHNLSRGEMTRLTLSLSFAFRDVWENLFHPINLLFIDELLDNGLDPVGMENALSILKGMGRERNKSVWFISHRDELIGRVNNVLKVVKENGYTEFRAYE